MGILDEAIKEHLDLKRKHGAREAEVEQLEKEAFGPPSRPGDPDFPERAAAADSPTGEISSAAIPASAGPAPPALAPEQAPEAAEISPEERAVREEAASHETAPHDLEPGGPTEPEAGGPEAEEHAIVPEAEPAGEPGAEPTPTPEAPDSSSTQPFELEDMDDLELDFEGELDDFEDVFDDEEDLEDRPSTPLIDPDPHGDELPPAPVGTVPPADFTAPPPPLEETQAYDVEESFGVEEDVVPPPPPPPAEGEPPPKLETDDHDLLEDTPEFLRDDPSEDELWFEQRKPQDFDFEDEK